MQGIQFQPTILLLRGYPNLFASIEIANPSLLQINVFLRITNKREDGYHDLASLFHVSLDHVLANASVLLFSYMNMIYLFLSIPYLLLWSVQVISLGDIIKFSLSPSKTKDRLSTNVSGVPLDDRNLVRRHTLLFSFYVFSSPCSFS